MEVHLALHLVRGGIFQRGDGNRQLVAIVDVGNQGEITRILRSGRQLGPVAPRHLHHVIALGCLSGEGVGAVGGIEGEVAVYAPRGGGGGGCVGRGDGQGDVVKLLTLERGAGGGDVDLRHGKEVLHLELIAFVRGAAEGAVFPVVAQQAGGEAEGLLAMHGALQIVGAAAAVVLAEGVVGILRLLACRQGTGERGTSTVGGGFHVAEAGVHGTCRAEDAETVVGGPEHTGDVAAVGVGVDAGAGAVVAVVDVGHYHYVPSGSIVEEGVCSTPCQHCTCGEQEQGGKGRRVIRVSCTHGPHSVAVVVLVHSKVVTTGKWSE